jgi:hypothetical protein
MKQQNMKNFHKFAVCSFRWIVVAESIVRWFIVREKHYWMVVDSADMFKRTIGH